MKFEIFYSDGGHGGPYKSVEAAREQAKRYLRGGKASWVAIVPYDKMTDFDPKKPGATAKAMVHRKDIEKSAALRWSRQTLNIPRGGRAGKKASFRGRGSGDPRWVRAKYPGVADDGTPFRKGEEVLYWPVTKTFMVGKKAQDAWRRFESEIADEDMFRFSSEKLLRDRVIRLAYENPELREELLPLLREARLRSGQKFVVVDVRTPGGKMIGPIYDSARAADKAAEKESKRLGVEWGTDIQVIDAAWYAPAAEMLRLASRSTDPADKSYDLISKHESLVKHLQKKIDSFAASMKRVNRDVQGADVYGGKHLAALDLMKKQVIPYLEQLRDEVDFLVKQAEQATR